MKIGKIALILFAVLLSAFFLFSAWKKTYAHWQHTQQISAFYDSLTERTSRRCTLTDKHLGTSTTYWIVPDVIRIEGQDPKTKTKITTVYTNNSVTTWDTTAKQGIVVNANSLEGYLPSATSKKELAADFPLEDFDISCAKIEPIQDLASIPEDIQFSNPETLFESEPLPADEQVGELEELLSE